MTDVAAVAQRAALLGTVRTSREELLTAADQLLGPGGGSVEGRLLELAAATGRMSRAAAVPALDPVTTLPFAPPASRPVTGRGASALALLLAGRSLDECAEALDLLLQLGLAPDADSLVTVLERATTQAGLRPAARRLVGERGRWLAALNPDWSWALPVSGPDAVESGDTEAAASRWECAPAAERLVLLAAARARDPALGRALMARVDPMARAGDVVKLLAVLQTGLGLDDEEMLEGWLRNTRRSVREAAADLLVDLQGSAYAERAIVRALQWLRIVGAANPTLVVDPPVGVDVQARADQVGGSFYPGEPHPWGLLRGMVRVAAPTGLAARLGVPVRRLVELAAASELAAPLLDAFRHAACRRQDLEVLLTLVPHVPLLHMLYGLDDATQAALIAATAEHGGPEDRGLLDIVSAVNIATGRPGGPLTGAALRALLPAMIDEAEQSSSWVPMLEAAIPWIGAVLSIEDGAPEPELLHSTDPNLDRALTRMHEDLLTRRASRTRQTTFREQLRAALLSDAR